LHIVSKVFTKSLHSLDNGVIFDKSRVADGIKDFIACFLKPRLRLGGVKNQAFFLKYMKELEIRFIGRGQVKGFIFTQIKKNSVGYIYKVETENSQHFEVFKRKENAKYNCVSYPSDKSFGIWAWTYKSLEQANNKLEDLGVTLG
jgi:hypothetical protein